MYTGSPANAGYMRDPEKGVDLLKVFPTAFGLGCFLIFASPVVKMLDIVFDPSVAFWMGVAPQIVVFTPVPLVLAAFGISWVSGSPSRSAVLLGMAAPALVLAILSERVMEQSVTYSVRLGSRDCHSFLPKYELERSRKAAVDLQRSCGARIIEECADYSMASTADPNWDYLARVERRHACGGWCEPGRPVWGFGEVPGDACSTAVSEVLGSKVLQGSTQVFVYSLVVLAVVSLVMVWLGPTIREAGVDW